MSLLYDTNGNILRDPVIPAFSGATVLKFLGFTFLTIWVFSKAKKG